MNSTAGIQNVVSKSEPGYETQFRAQVGQHLGRQHPVVRGLHRVLQGVALVCLALPVIFLVVASYHTFLWAATGSFTSLGKATYLPDAWVNFGLSMSLLVFPWGLDSMLLRIFPVFPAVIFPVAWYQPSKPIRLVTGLGAFFAGLGIMCAGAPGAAYFAGLASQALQKLF